LAADNLPLARRTEHPRTFVEIVQVFRQICQRIRTSILIPIVRHSAVLFYATRLFRGSACISTKALPETGAVTTDWQRACKSRSQIWNSVEFVRCPGKARTKTNSWHLESTAVTFTDRVLTCIDCSAEFVFSAGEQLFFHDKEFKNDPKRCKSCKARRRNGEQKVRRETRTKCAECGEDTTVPFWPTQGRPVLCRPCFRKQATPQLVTVTGPSALPPFFLSPQENSAAVSENGRPLISS
jgi:CxxC-x17-CxxC domain-containing protein